MGGGAAVYLAAVLEYIVGEIVELAGNVARDSKVKRITPRHILLAIKGDDDLDELVLNLNGTIPYGGVKPHIHKNLLKKKSKSAEE